MDTTTGRLHPNLRDFLKLVAFISVFIGVPFIIFASITASDPTTENSANNSNYAIWTSIILGVLIMILSIIQTSIQTGPIFDNLKTIIFVCLGIVYLSTLVSYIYFIKYINPTQPGITIFLNTIVYPLMIVIGYFGILFMMNITLQEGLSARFELDKNVLYISITLLTIFLWIYYFIFHGTSTQGTGTNCNQSDPLRPVILNNVTSTSGTGEGFQSKNQSSSSSFMNGIRHWFSLEQFTQQNQRMEEPFQTSQNVTIESLTNQRTFSDFSMITVAYPTLNDSTTPPNPNTNETFGSHSISNLQNILNQGIFSFYQDIYYNDTKKQWFIGTINQSTGDVQNITTIPLSEFLNTIKEYQTATTSKRKYNVLFFNPQYTSSQLSKRTELENELATLFNNSQTNSSSNIIGSIQRESIANVNIHQVIGSLIYILGGKVPSSEKLLKSIHGMVDFTTLRLNSGKPPVTINTELPTNNIQSRVSVFNVGDTSLDTFKRGATASSTGTQNSNLLMVFPASTSSDIPYSPQEIPHIVYGAHFTVVYPKHILKPTTFENPKNRILWNGYGNSTVLKDAYVQSVLMTVDKNVIDNENPLCNTPEPKHLNPANDTTWGNILQSGSITRSNYCDKSKGGISESLFNGLRFYQGTKGSGIIPRPSVVQYCLGEGGCSLYYLRDKKQITETTVTSA
jgi:hypothetical protein